MISNFFKGRHDFYGIGDSTVRSRLAKTDMADSAYGWIMDAENNIIWHSGGQ